MKKIIPILLCSTMAFANIATAQEFDEIKKPNKPAVNESEVDCGNDLDYDEDADLIYHKKTQRPFTGLCRSYFEDGSLEREVRFESGKEDGESVTLYKPNTEGKQIMMVKVNHKMGVPVGTWDFFYESGRRAWTETYVNGVKHGNCNYFDEEGKPKKEEVYKNGLKEGTCKEYHKGGKIKSEITYKEGIIDGQLKTYYENGQISYEGKYTAGKENGEVVTYFEKGQMSSQTFFKNGIIDGEFRTWFDDSHEKIIVKFIMGKKEGEAKEFYKDGQIKKLEKWVAGKLMEIEAYDEYGNVIDPDELKK
jgi:antitoxin component YwqK of YwqJK toxin-antitoxin module